MTNFALSSGYIVFSILLLPVLQRINALSGMTTRARDSDDRYLIAAGNSVAVVDNKTVYGGVVLMACLIGGAIGWSLPMIWMTPAETIGLDRAAQIVGCACWFLAGYLVLGWALTLIYLGCALALMAALVVLPYTYITKGNFNVDLGFAHGASLPSWLNVPQKIADWRASRVRNDQVKSVLDEGPTTPVNLDRYLGVWRPRDDEWILNQPVQVRKDGVVEFYERTPEKRVRLSWFGNGQVLLGMDGDRPVRYYRIVEANTLAQGIFDADGKVQRVKQFKRSDETDLKRAQQAMRARDDQHFRDVMRGH